MPDTQYKRRTLNPAAPNQPSPWNVRGGAPFDRHWFENVLKAQDTFLESARRTVAHSHMGGQTTAWMVADTDPDAQGSQTHPDPDDKREVWRHWFAMAPGSMLEIRSLYVPAGSTQTFTDPTWDSTGPAGAVIFALTWDNGAATDSTEHVIDHEPSLLQYGKQADGINGVWPTIRCAYASIAVPNDDWAVNSEATKWSEYTLVSSILKHRGGARSIHAHMVEIPKLYVLDHNEAAGSAHCYPASTQHPDAFPQTDSVDGATYEERRFGTHQGLDVARNQADKSGPIIFQWSSFYEGPGGTDGGNPGSPVTANFPPSPISVTGTTQKCLWDSSITSWRYEAPGFAVPGSYARRDRECNDLVLLGEQEACIPVRITVWAQDSGSDGQVIVQTSSRSLIRVPVTASSYARFTITGFLECMRAGDDATDINGIVFAQSNGGADTIDVRYVSIEYCDFAVG